MTRRITRRITRHEADPTPDQGSITVWSEREHAVSAFRISAPAGAVELLDLDQRVALPAHGPAAVEDYLGPIVFPDIASYRRGSAWRLATVLEQLGVDAGEIAEVDLDDAHPCPEDGPECEEHEFTGGLCTICGQIEAEEAYDDAVGHPYDLAEMPPGDGDDEDDDGPSPESWMGAVDAATAAAEAFHARIADSGGISTLTEDMRIALQTAERVAVEALWPGQFMLEVSIDHEERRFNTALTRKAAVIDPGLHAAAWSRFMAENDPRGYEILETSQGWKWRTLEHRTVEAVNAGSTAEDVAAVLQAELVKLGHTQVIVHPTKPDRAAARASAWSHYLELDAHVLADILAMAGLWPEIFDPETSTYKAAEGFEVELDRLTWIQGWTLLERGLASEWAVATHVAASDNDDVEIPPRPPCLDRGRPR